MKSTERFSDRVADYVRYRPSYPDALLTRLVQTGAKQVADIGSGTGILTALLLDQFEWVVAVEPNAPMRAAATSWLSGRLNFHSQDAQAEATGLADDSVDLVVAAQAFHWFDLAAARTEFSRILRPGGSVGLIWNSRQVERNAFLRGYEALLQRWCPGYGAIRHRGVSDAEFDAFFGAGRWERAVYDNAQHLDRAGLHGRLRSSSYAPQPDHPNHTPMMTALDVLFDAHQQDGAVTVYYDTELTIGTL